MNTTRRKRINRLGPAPIVWFAMAMFAISGETHTWNQITGGSFHVPSHWTPESVPGNLDTARFTSNETYAVTFPDSVVNEAVAVIGGEVSFDLGGNTYTLDGKETTQAIDIGQTAALVVSNGTLSSAQRLRIQSAAHSATPAALVVTNGAQVGVVGMEIAVARYTQGKLILSGTNVAVTGTINWSGNLGNNGGRAMILVEDGARLTVGSAAAAGPSHAESEFHLVVRDAGSQFQCTGDLQFARSGAATALIEDGGTLLLASTAIGWGNNNGRPASVTVTSADSVFHYTGKELKVGDAEYHATLTVEDGGLIACTHGSSILTLLAPNAALRGAGGTVRVNIRVSNAGLVAPGNADEGTGILTLEGDYRQTSTGALRIKIASNGQHDALHVEGDVDLAGTLKVALIGDSMAAGTFDVLVASGGIAGSINLIADDTAHPDGLPDGYAMGYAVKQDGESSVLRVTVKGPPQGTLFLLR